MQKQCRKCGEVKDASQFTREKRYRDGLHPYCKACKAANTRVWNAKHPDYKQEYVAANQDRLRDYRRSYRAANTDQLRTKEQVYRGNNLERVRAKGRNWMRQNPDRNAASRHQYRAKCAGTGGSYTAEEWRALCEKYNHRCLCCGEQKSLTVDHVIPLSQGGTSNISNIQPLCAQCNTKKANRTIDYRY